MADDLGEKTEAPTGKRLSDARGKGQVPKSIDVASAVTLIAATAVFIVFAPGIAADLAGLMTRLLSGQTLEDQTAVSSMTAAVVFSFKEAGVMMLPIMILMFFVAYVSNFMQVGPLFTTHPIKPTLSKLNPIQGIKRTFGKKGLMKTATGLLKLIFVILVTWLVMRRHMGSISSIARLEILPAVWGLAMIAAELLAWLLLILLVVGVIDLIYQRWQHKEDLKMTKQEVKDERKGMEGDPEMKGRRMQMARDIALQKIQSDVPQADVIVTNPTHYSVALRYDNTTMAAPRVIASGVDFMAMRIRHVALAAGVPLVERPPLARALYHGVKVGHEVPAEHYEAVAEILAYVYRLEGRAAEEASSMAGAAS